MRIPDQSRNVKCKGACGGIPLLLHNFKTLEMYREIFETSTPRTYFSRTQAHREGGESGSNAPRNNLRNMKDKQAH